MGKSILLIILILSLGNGFAQIDSTRIRPERNLLRKSIVPASLIASGILLSDSRFEKSLNTTTRNWVGNGFYSHVDDYTRYAPVAQLYIADIVGVEARNHWFDQTKNLAISMVLTDVLTNFLKGRIYKVRPDGFNAKSFPSGHTSIAFSTGSVLYEEFRETSPILAYSGYGFAAVTGGMRMANNRHYVSDVLAGAGIGILMTKLIYHFDYLFQWNPFLKSRDISLVPRYSEGNVGLYFSKTF